MSDEPILPPITPRLSPSYGEGEAAVQKPPHRRRILGLLAGGLAAAALERMLSMSGSAFVGRAAAADPLRIVALGDSLTAGYMLPPGGAFPDQLQKVLRAKGYAVEIANAGVSGDTATQGLERLDWSVPDGTQAVIVELGANDALRGIDPAVTRKALDAIVTRLKSRGIAVMLAGMLSPRNMGSDYARAFDAIYPDLAAKHGVPLYPFFLDGIAGVSRLNLKDGIHPTVEGVGIIVQRILPSVEAFLATLRKPA